MTELSELQKKVNYDKTFDCVQCGYCLPACPTYETMKKETHSPRGRINLVKQYAEGKIGIDVLKEPIEKCLGCNACAVVCPTNVQYGKILEGAKQAIEEEQPKTKRHDMIDTYIFKNMFPSRKWMTVIGNGTWLYQRFGLQKLARSTGLTKLAPLHLGQFEKVLPDVPSPNERSKRASYYKAEGKSVVKVGFFTGCIMDSVFFGINKKTIELLTKSGADVFIPETQTCCGALHAHQGKSVFSKELAKTNIEAFEKMDVDLIVNNAGGCGARLVEYDDLFQDDDEWRERAEQFVKKTRDISEVLDQLDNLRFTEKVNEVVTYQPSCHMLNVQRVSEQPLRLLTSVPGITFSKMKQANRCCASAGIYNMLNYDESMEILDSKMKNTKETQAHTIVTTNPGCYLQMKLGVEREALDQKMRVVHLVELLSEAGPERK